MALRHIALFRWQDGTTPEQVARVEEALGALPGVISALDAYAFGPDLGIGPGTFDFAVVADVADESAFVAYRDHPEHQAALSVIGPLLADRAAVQFQV
ncbi:Dabb family protein [Nocardiopsis sp. JB363]|uniref:Dabb family protein n=1 Tax=Nocardiopsis sp. JB363 TaxID=1434837 RepID=UPI00097B2A26|nr:Dabb family protein [Nocardiopsis sp. JB363]SIO87273.1 stress responsive A/B Barrel Domain superfamily protein [Nocardiopsis sp. JB363]